MNSIAIARAVDRSDVALLDAQAADDYLCEAWTERRAEVIEEMVIDALTDVGLTRAQIRQFAESRAEFESERGDWKKGEDL